MRRTPPRKRVHHLSTIMPQQTRTQLAQKEERIAAAISAIERNEVPSVRKAAALYSASETTLRQRRAGRPSRRDYRPKTANLTKQEEETLVKYILELGSRGYPPTPTAVRDMANALLAQRGANEVGIKWPSNYVQRTEALQMKYTRK
jgi:hypothetical protein